MIGRFRPTILSFATRVKGDDGEWHDTTVNTAGYEDTGHSEDPSFLVLREQPSELSDGVAILRLLITNQTYITEAGVK